MEKERQNYLHHVSKKLLNSFVPHVSLFFLGKKRKTPKSTLTHNTLPQRNLLFLSKKYKFWTEMSHWKCHIEKLLRTILNIPVWKPVQHLSTPYEIKSVENIFQWSQKKLHPFLLEAEIQVEIFQSFMVISCVNQNVTTGSLRCKTEN